MSESGRLLYVLWEWPSRSELFIQRELEALAREGCVPTLMVLGPSTAQEPAETPWVALRPIDGLRLIAVAPFAFLRAPLGAMRCLLAAVGAVRAGTRPRTTVRLAARMIVQLARWRGPFPQHIHAHFATLPATAALLLARATRRPFSFSAHARDVWGGDDALAHKLRHASFSVCCSRALASSLAAKAGASDPAPHLIHHGLGVTEHTVRRPAHEQVPLLLAAGRMCAKKGFRVLVQACAELSRRGLSFACEIVGDGPEYDELLSLRDGLQLKGIVEFRGWLDSTGLAGRMRQSSVLVVPSVVARDGDRDGIPNVILEAFAAELPVVGSRVGGIPEALADGEAGLLVAPGDPIELAEAIQTMLADSNLSAKLTDAGRRRLVEEFDPQVGARALLRLVANSSEEARWQRD